METVERFLSRLSRMRVRDILTCVVKYRYVLALILFVALTALRVNGSSVSVWSNYLTGSSSNVLVGQARPIRSDEWATQTPYYVAQAQSQTPYSVVNPDISISGQNMIVSYGAPVWDISLLAKPLSWGFLLFGPSYGLAWYWNMKMLLLFLLSFELCRLITRGNTFVSLLGSFWIALSPAVQWWFMQHVCDILLHMEAVVVLFVCYLQNIKKPWPLKLLIAFGFWMSCCGFALTIYPALQISLAYLGVVMMVVFFWNMRKQIKPGWRDAVIVGVTAVFAFLMMAHVYLVSKDAIHAILNTSYPGKRVSVGGEGSFAYVNIFLSNVFLPFKDASAMFFDNCSASSFFQFLPAAAAGLPVLIKKRKGNLKIGVALGVFSLLSLFYLYVRIPEFLAKITLLSYVTVRISNAYGIAAMLMSIWALGELSSLAKEERIRPLYAVAVSMAIGVFYLVSVYFTSLRGYVRLRYMLAVIFVFVLLGYCLLRGRQWTFGVLMSAVVFVSGVFVNPVSVGVGALTDSALATEVRNLAKEEPNARWVSISGGWVMGGLLYANGAKTLDGTNYYPDTAKWALLDPQGKYTDIYNRYAHIQFNLTDGSTSFSSPYPDVVEANITVEDLKKLGVNYLLSSAEIPGSESAGVTFSRLTATPLNGYYIYRMVYTDD